MRKILANAFSINMIPAMYGKIDISFTPINQTDIPKDVHSVIGHADTAAIISNLLGFEVPCNRETYKFEPGDVLYVAQYRGPRLEEGTTKLPADASILFWEVKEVQ